MKSIRIFAALTALAAVFGCGKELSPAEAGDNVGTVLFSGAHIVSKTSPSYDGTVSWSTDDRIGVYDGENYVLAETVSVNGNAITFSAEVNVGAENYIAVVPYEAALAEGAFATEGSVKMLSCANVQEKGTQVYCIASTTAAEKSFQFRNVGNLIRFTVKKDGVAMAKFQGNDGEKIAGTLSVNPADGTCTSSELDADCITVPAVKGENYIALAPGISLGKGFTLTLYGDSACTDYQGEICGSKALSLTRNDMKDLGTIDGWIDNYKLWQAGKPITIAGVEYTKSSTGFAGELLSATEADYNLFSKLYGKAGVFFLEQSGDYKFITDKFINIGTASSALDVILISRFDNSPVTCKPVKQFTLMNGNFAAKGVNFEIKAADYSVNYLFRPFTAATFGNLHLDGCKYSVDNGTKKFLSFDNKTLHAVKSVRVVNSRIESTFNGLVYLAYSSTDYPFLNEIEEFTFENCAIYNPNAGGTVQLFGTAGPAPSSGSQRTAFKLTGCTFYNMAPTTYLQSNSMGSLIVKNNLFYSESTPSGNTIVAYSKDETNEYSYEFENNFCGNFNNLYWFNPYNGIYKTLKKTVTKTSASMFTTADTGSGTFIQAEEFKSCGANL